MAFNPANLLKIQEAWRKFAGNHPKFPLFVDALRQKGVSEDTVIEVSITRPDGTKLETNLKVTEEDMELFEMLRNS